MTDIRQNKKYAKYLENTGWIVEEKDGVFYFIKRILFFSIMKIQRPSNINLAYIEKLRQKYKIIQIFVEPRTFKEADELIEKGWKLSFPYIPSKTVLMDITPTKKALFASFTKDTRYSIRKSDSIKITQEQDLEKFRKYWKASVDMKRYVLKIKQMKALGDAFGKDCIFLIAEDGISGGIFLVAGEVGYYWYGFASKTGRKKLSQYKLLWEGIKWAKGRGAKYFDMEGVFDERFPIPAWRGFSKFKKSFGGRVKKFPGAYQETKLKF